MYVISDNTDTRTGFRLVGVDGVVAHTRDEIQDALRLALEDREIGIILIMEKMAAQFSDIIDDIKLKRRLPLIVEIPDRHGTGRKKDFLTQYVREAIGVKL
jgi:V/A-type H+-transporting ATPase subunit F